MSHSSRPIQTQFEVRVVPCPPDHAAVWVDAMLLWWQMIAKVKAEQGLSQSSLGMNAVVEKIS
jgi:hypothetical protein